MFSSRKSSAPSGGILLTKSLRLRSSASGYLNRTPTSSGSQTTFTLSSWIKRGIVNGSTRNIIFSSGSSTTMSVDIYYQQGATVDTIWIEQWNGTQNYLIQTTGIYRDPSSWYHVVCVVDTTQATASNRLKIYINGTQATITATYPTQNFAYPINTSSYSAKIGLGTQYSSQYFDGYMTDVYFIDGQSLTPSSFGSFSGTGGVWQPKAYSGTYGTNGFHLTFTNTTSTTTLGYDTSGNSNNWTTNNISLTAGSTYDSMNDVPTLTSATASNYCVWNSNYNPQTAVITDGNLTLSTAGSSVRYGTYTTIGVSSGKFYWEITAGPLSTDGYEIGIVNSNKSLTSALGTDTNSYVYLSGGSTRTNGTTVAYGATFTAGDVIGVAMDLNAGTLIFYKNGTSQGTAFTSIPTATWFPTVADDNTGSTTGSSFYANFGQQPFTYTPPSGYNALNTYNLPTPSIAQGNKYMDATLYTGTLIAQSITNASSFQPDLVWIKSRSAATDHKLTDSVRGVTKALISDTTGAETTDTLGLTTFNSNGFTISTDTNYNNSGATYVAWQWKAGGTSGSNTNGSITSTVSANTTSGFSVVTYTGTGANATVGHGLGVAPSMVIVKKRSATGSWVVYHVALPNATYYLLVNSTNPQATSATVWNSTAPTSSVFSIGTDTDVNASASTNVAYCFAPIAGFSAFGIYTGNGSTTGPFIYTGFQPKWILIKRSDTATTASWDLYDTTRNPYNSANLFLNPNSSAVEGTATSLNALSNGFQLVSTLADLNASGGTYIYAAFASSPFKYSNAF